MSASFITVILELREGEKPKTIEEMCARAKGWEILYHGPTRPETEPKGSDFEKYSSSLFTV